MGGVVADWQFTAQACRDWPNLLLSQGSGTLRLRGSWRAARNILPGEGRRAPDAVYVLCHFTDDGGTSDSASHFSSFLSHDFFMNERSQLDRRRAMEDNAEVTSREQEPPRGAHHFRTPCIYWPLMTYQFFEKVTKQVDEGKAVDVVSMDFRGRPGVMRKDVSRNPPQTNRTLRTYSRKVAREDSGEPRLHELGIRGSGLSTKGSLLQRNHHEEDLEIEPFTVLCHPCTPLLWCFLEWFAGTPSRCYFCTSSLTAVISSLFSLLSLTVNFLAIVILSRGKCGLSTCTTCYLVAMATADLMVIITEVILMRIVNYYFQGSFLNITPVCSANIVLLRAASDCSVWFTVTFTFDRFFAICCQKLKTKYCTEKTASVVLATTCTLLCLKNIPFYFAYESREIIGNVPWGCSVKPSYFTEPGWVGFDWFDTVLIPLLPFSLILLLNTLTVRHILVTSQVRKGLRGQSKGENRSDPEMESRRKSMILLFTISGSFILLWLVYVIHFFYYSITGTQHRDYNNSEYIFVYVGYMLQLLSCCTNTFIYAVTQSKFREQLKCVVKYPVKSIIQLINKQN
ncbi:mu-type opioid receptor-like [Heterodontus francisci]|uniref:mu-type opioid receptor-like n=1 Tax=Heterodontus francisci TaxID=7792 RepID=UPI00355BF8F6